MLFIYMVYNNLPRISTGTYVEIEGSKKISMPESGNRYTKCETLETKLFLIQT